MNVSDAEEILLVIFQTFKIEDSVAYTIYLETQ